METPEQRQEVEQKSSIKISTTAKGDVQVEVKVYDGVDGNELDRIRGLAVGAYRSTKAAVA